MSLSANIQSIQSGFLTTLIAQRLPPAPAPFILPPIPLVPQLVQPLPQQQGEIHWNNAVIPQIPPPNLDFLKIPQTPLPIPVPPPNFDFSPLRNLVVKVSIATIVYSALRIRFTQRPRAQCSRSPCPRQSPSPSACYAPQTPSPPPPCQTPSTRVRLRRSSSGS